MGRPTYEEESNIKLKVFNMLPSDGRAVRWIHIEKQARHLKMSLTTVRKYLDQFEEVGMVKRQLVDAKPPGVYYSRVNLNVRIGYQFLPKTGFDVNSWLEELSEVSKLPKDQRELFLISCLEYFLSLINMFIIGGLKGKGGEKFFKLMRSIYITPTIQGLRRMCQSMNDISPRVLDDLVRRQGDKMLEELDVHLKIPIPSQREGHNWTYPSK